MNKLTRIVRFHLTLEYLKNLEMDVLSDDEEYSIIFRYIKGTR